MSFLLCCLLGAALSAAAGSRPRSWRAPQITPPPPCQFLLHPPCFNDTMALHLSIISQQHPHACLSGSRAPAGSLYCRDFVLLLLLGASGSVRGCTGAATLWHAMLCARAGGFNGLSHRCLPTITALQPRSSHDDMKQSIHNCCFSEPPLTLCRHCNTARAARRSRRSGPAAPPRRRQTPRLPTVRSPPPAAAAARSGGWRRRSR